MSYDGIINAIAAFLGGGALLGLAKAVASLRESKSASRIAEADAKIKEEHAASEIAIAEAVQEVNEWKQLHSLMVKQIAAADSKMDKIRSELQERIDTVQNDHLKCQLELAATKAQLHEQNERLVALEGRGK